VSNRQYPRIGGSRAYKPARGQKKPLKTPPCAACASPAVTRVSIQVNWFRGDDEERPACALHKLDPIALLAAGEKA
jgi:hypothetical protein